MKNFVMLLSLVLLCSGCDMAARQQAREEARRAEAAKELKAIGESMHGKQGDAPAGESPAAAEPKSDSAPPSESREEMK